MPTEGETPRAEDRAEDGTEFFRNDEGARVTFGSDGSSIYCGRNLGEAALPGSDGRCGPEDGPACASCRRFRSGPGRVDLLLRFFPSVADRGVAVAALRTTGGVTERAADFLAGKGATRADGSAVLPPLPPENARNEVDPDEVQRLAESLGALPAVAEAALRRHADVQEAAAWILDSPEEAEAAAAEGRAAADAAAEAEREAREAMEEAARAAKGAEVPEEVAALGAGCVSFPPLGGDGAGAMAVDGHRMILCAPGEDCHCVLCASELPGRHGGTHRCELCGLCEGCVRSGGVVRRCPMLRNGSCVHTHPLAFGLDHTRNRCDIGGNSCASVMWRCTRGCDFDVCCACMCLENPHGDSAARGEDAEQGSDSDSESESSEEESQTAPEIDSQAFDAIAAERRAAARWEATHEEPQTGDIIVGSGETGHVILSPLVTEGRGPDDQREARRLLKSEATKVSEAKLSNEAELALDSFGSHASSDKSKPVVSAADFSLAEDVLHKARTITDDPRVHRELCEAISKGRIDLAGAVLLSAAYAPAYTKTDNCGDGGSGAESEPMECWCGEPLDKETAPDGVVGCLGGHAMHPSCAVELLLSGGSCPECRLPLHFPKVPEEESRIAMKLVDDELMRKFERTCVGPDDEWIAKVDDFVRICDDQRECARAQMEEPRAGGWVDTMAEACGKVGIIKEIVETEPSSEVISAKVRTKAVGHSLERIRGNYKCKGCDMFGPSRQTGQMKCVRCQLCGVCCQKAGDRPCPKSSDEWVWAVSLLRPASSALLDTSLLEPEEAAARKAERHVLRLRAELKAISAARESLRVEYEGLDLPQLVRCQKYLTAESIAALRDLWGKVSFADWLRARHLLGLVNNWGESNDVDEAKASIFNAVREGDLDSVARAVRKHSVAQKADDMLWDDAAHATCEYFVAPTSKVGLQAFPSRSSPKTGFVLRPGTYFKSQQELLDKEGNLWILVDPKSFPGVGKSGGKVVSNLDNQMTSEALIGAKVCRGPDWKWDDQDGGKGNEGVIVQVNRSNKVTVRWNGDLKKHEYRAGGGSHDLSFAGAAPQPPQGWLCSRPAGRDSLSVVHRATSAVRCFCCGDGLVPPKNLGRKHVSAKGEALEVGDRMLVAATLESVVVRALSKGRVCCSFEDQAPPMSNDDLVDFNVWYRPEDLVVRKGNCNFGDEESLEVLGQERSRRELVLLSGGDVEAARQTWAKARKDAPSKEKLGRVLNFASCVRGHFLHARCLQGALLSGGTCPAVGCPEPLFVPRVKHMRNDDTCCGGSTDDLAHDNSEEGEEVDLLRATQAARRREPGAEVLNEENARAANLSGLKMCPVCCSGPLVNKNCSDMKAHHGQCSRAAIRGTGGDESPCTENGSFRVTPVEIAEKIKHMSSTQTVSDVLPRCPKHNVMVMFNGCLSCGHLFTDTDWGDMPEWDPKAKALLELDHKKRKAAGLLARQVRVEANFLTYEREQFKGISTDPFICPVCPMATDAKLPPLPPPTSKYAVRGCGPNCDLRHSGDGDCLVCGRDWGVHSGHTCPGGRTRGSWMVR